MLVVVLFAAYDFFIGQPASKKAKQEAKPIEIESFITKVTQDVGKTNISELDSYIIKKAELEWVRNPFWSKEEYREFAGKDASGGLASKIVYSGYVDAGRKKMAVINGFEYEAGDSLEIEGYFLKSITPSKILIVNRYTGGELTIPIQD
jgi:hypothetical protein